MPGMSTALQQNILLFLLARTPMPAAPSSVFISLHTADPGQTGASEVTTTASTGWVGYARQSVTCGSAAGTAGANLGTEGTAGTGTAWGAPAASGTLQKSTNNNIISFPASASNSGTVVVTHVGFYDAVTAGNYIMSFALATNQTIGPNAAGPTFATAALGPEMQ